MTQKTDRTLSRRHAVAGLGTVGAAVAAVSLLPSGGSQTVTTAQAPSSDASASSSSGYQLTEHVRRYYQTART